MFTLLLMHAQFTMNIYFQQFQIISFLIPVNYLWLVQLSDVNVNVNVNTWCDMSNYFLILELHPVIPIQPNFPARGSLILMGLIETYVLIHWPTVPIKSKLPPLVSFLSRHFSFLSRCFLFLTRITEAFSMAYITREKPVMCNDCCSAVHWQIDGTE